MLFVDLEKVFVIEDHDFLIEMHSHYGIGIAELKWFCSYLNSRIRWCKVNGKLSYFEYIVCGVPQGPCLGPLLFLLYINELPFAL